MFPSSVKPYAQALSYRPDSLSYRRTVPSDGRRDCRDGRSGSPWRWFPCCRLTLGRLAASPSVSRRKGGPCSRDWPGVYAVRALLEGEVLEGLWFDRTKEYAARRRGERFDRLQYATREVLELDPLPCWKHLTEEERRKRTASLVADIETEAAARRQRTGICPRGPAAVLAQNPLRRPL
jgi:hypothetical protein